MTTHKRSQNQTAISVSIPVDLLTEVDERARLLGLNRSQYLIQLAKQDLTARGDLTLRETPPSYKVSSAQKAKTDEKVGKIVREHFPPSKPK